MTIKDAAEKQTKVLQTLSTFQQLKTMGDFFSERFFNCTT